MSEQQKFSKSNPFEKEDKLIVELIKDLDATTHAFIKLNNKGDITQEMFFILSKSAIIYCAEIVCELSKSLVDKNQVELFIRKSKKLFNDYIDMLYEKEFLYQIKYKNRKRLAYDAFFTIVPLFSIGLIYGS